MEAYQEEYLALQGSLISEAEQTLEELGPEAFMTQARARAVKARQAIDRGTRLLREGLFPVLDDILSAGPEQIESLRRFAGQLMSLREQKDVGLHYRIHLALMDYARHKRDRDLLIRELYEVGMALYNMDSALGPNAVRLYSTRMRLCFSECASYFETEYDDITDPEIRGYIHRSMGNIALSYTADDPETAGAKLRAIDRSIRVLSDPEVRAKTPSLPWDLYLYKSHQERTTMLSYLRSGHAGADVFAQVLESTQIVEQRQQRAARERGAALQPRWQYAYYAAQYHCGILELPEFLDVLRALAAQGAEGDPAARDEFSAISAPAMFMHYAARLPEGRQEERLAGQIEVMTRQMLRWLIRAAGSGSAERMFYVRQFLYAYLELPGCPPFFEVLQDVFAACLPLRYVRMWLTGRIARRLCAWAIDDIPERMAGLLGCADGEEARARRAELEDYASRAGRLCDTGMLHFTAMENLTCRGLFLEEETMLQLHAYCGSELLSQRPSTAACADVAYGHHCRYDEKGGYPLGFSPARSPARQMIWLCALADALAGAGETDLRSRSDKSFAQTMADALEGAGGRFSPFAVELLRPAERRAELERDLELWRREAYLDLYRRRAALLK